MERATRTAETIDGLERNGREEKLLIDKKSRNKETIDGMKRNGRVRNTQEEQQQYTDKKNPHGT